MLKRNLWKIILSLAVVTFAAMSLIPLKDRGFVEFVKVEASAHQTEFDALLKEAHARAVSKQAPSDFIALKQIAKERNIDLTAQFFPNLNLGDVKNIERKNAILLDYLLKDSKARLQLGLDLKGGVAFTLEIDPKALEGVSPEARKEKLAKAIDIIGSRINSFGVTEPIIRPIGDNRLEVQLPGINTKDNPDVIESLQKPALLEFRMVHPTLTPATSSETPAGYERMSLEEDSRTGTRIEDLYIKLRPEADGSIMASAGVYRDTYGKPEISLNFSKEGRARFYAVTKAIVDEHTQLGLPASQPGRLAIVLDGKLYSAPSVKEPIDSPSARISGNFTDRDAQNLANVLNNPLDVPMVVKEQYEVGPTLAEDAVSSGLRSAVIGTTLVGAFMIVFYSAGGLVAVGMLVINLIVIFGIMAQFGATLTLPGLAGIVLTVGMAVDANILIFERMREEIALGKSLSAANRSGFSKALWTILDAHFVQLIICAIMIIFGTGPIRGFGVTLAIGVVSTLFSVLITGHMLLELAIDSGLLKKITMRHLLRHTMHVDFVKHGKTAFIASWLIVVLGIAVIAYKGGAIFGIDFKGGDVVTLRFDERIDTGKIRATATNAGVGEIQPSFVKAIGGDVEMLRIETGEGKSAVLLSALQKDFPQANFVSDSTTSIGAAVGKETMYNAVLAIGMSMLATLLYIALRFEFGFGIGAMFSSMHDILMTIGIFVLFGHHFSAPMVAAILAIAGYSINETVVVFDRIREELKINLTGSLKDVVNAAINKVFARTIMTSTTTLLAALSLFIWGGGVLRDISFTFMVGIITSTFSAIFISSQVFYWWHKGDRKSVEKHQDVKPTYEWTGSSKASQ